MHERGASLLDERRTFSFVHDFRKLRVWTRARDVVVVADRMTRQFPGADHGVIFEKADVVNRLILDFLAG